MKEDGRIQRKSDFRKKSDAIRKTIGDRIARKEAERRQKEDKRKIPGGRAMEGYIAEKHDIALAPGRKYTAYIQP